MITKNINGVTVQIYMALIVYLILQLMEIPVFYGNRLLDKFRYLQLELSRRCSILHWSYCQRCLYDACTAKRKVLYMDSTLLIL